MASKKTLPSQFLNFFKFWQQHVFLSAHAFMSLVILVDYTFGSNIDKIIGNWFYVAAVIAFLINWYFIVKIAHKEAARYVSLIIYSGITGIFLLYFADPLGPYFQLLVLLLLTSANWFGWTGVFVSLVVHMYFILLAVNYQQGISAEILVEIVLRFIILLVLGLLFGYTSRISKKRADLNKESALREVVSLEHGRLVALINSIGEAVIITDLNGNISIYNGAALDLLNTNISVTGKKFSDVVRLFTNEAKFYDIIEEAITSKKVIKREDLHFFTNQKETINIYVSISPIRSGISEQATSGFIIILRDITSEKTLDEERDEFISVTSHELRTPIAVAEANISTALLPQFSSNVDPKMQELLTQAHQNILFLSGLVNDLSTLARAERGSLKLKLKTLDPVDLLKQLYQTYLDEAKSKNLKLNINIVGKIPQIYNSELYMQEILQNFITNAIKYTLTGSVTLAVKALNSKGVVFSVKDTGIGIPKADQKRIFTKFFRSENFRTRQTRGTGLGLYITIKLAEKIKAKIHFESRLNHGSAFYIEVPSLKNNKDSR
jgi:PAS domain S-box-containing protein